MVGITGIMNSILSKQQLDLIRDFCRTLSRLGIMYQQKIFHQFSAPYKKFIENLHGTMGLGVDYTVSY